MDEVKPVNKASPVDGIKSESVPIKVLMSESGHRTLLGHFLYEVRNQRIQESGSFTDSCKLTSEASS